MEVVSVKTDQTTEESKPRATDFGVSNHFWRVWARGTGPTGEKMAAACPGSILMTWRPF